MSEQLNNILWMTEELDFSIDPSLQPQATEAIETFLESTAAPELVHWLYQA